MNYRDFNENVDSVILKLILYVFHDSYIIDSELSKTGKVAYA